MPLRTACARAHQASSFDLSERDGQLFIRCFGVGDTEPRDWGEVPAVPMARTVGDRRAWGFWCRFELDAIRQKIRAELPTLLNLYRADTYVLTKLVTSGYAFLEEVRADPDHPLRAEFDRFVAGFIEQLTTSPAYVAKIETLKGDVLAYPQLAELAQGMWDSFRHFLEHGRFKSIAHRANACRFILQGSRGAFSRFTQGDDGGNVFGSSATIVLLTAANQKRSES